MTDSVLIRPLRSTDRASWNALWQDYLTFYKTTLAPGVTETTFARFFDSLEQLHALVAEHEGRLVGFAHYLLHRSTWAEHCYCYLEDLFVSDAARGKGVGRALIAGVIDAGRAANATRVYWVTNETNTQARTLYDTIADRPGFIQYRKPLR